MSAIRILLHTIKYSIVLKIEYWVTNNLINHIPSNKLRCAYLKIIGTKIDGHIMIHEGFHIRNPMGISIGNGVSIGPKVLLDGRNGLKIGKSAVIAYDAIIWTLNHDYNDLNFGPKGAPVEIGDYAWVCSRSIILPGVKIGVGAVIASGAVVTKDVPPFSVVGGIPAKVIGQRAKKDYSYGYKK